MRSIKDKFHTKQLKQNNYDNLLYSFSKKIRSSQPLERCTFIDRVNGHIDSISSKKKTSKENQISRKNISQKTKKIQQKRQSIETIKQKMNNVGHKIRVEKQINKNLQKCIIEIQKILWERNERLQKIQDAFRQSQLNYRQQQDMGQSSDLESSAKINQSQKELRKYARSLGLKGILGNLNAEESSGNSSKTSVVSSQQSEQFTHQMANNLRRPRTESDAELPNKRRK